MRRRLILTFFLLLGLSVLSMADTRGKINVKVGDEIYACNMPESCPCDTMAMKPGKCKCGVELIKTRVTKVGSDTIYVESRGRDSRGLENIPVAVEKPVIAAQSARNPANVFVVVR